MWIYGIYNIKSNKWYIGQTTCWSARMSSHKTNLRANRHINKHLQRAWNKYGPSAFMFIQLDTASDVYELDLLEAVYVDLLHMNVYNILPGGDGTEIKSQMSNIRWAKPNALKWRKKMNTKIWSDPIKRERMLSGIRNITPKQKSEYSKKYWQNPEYRKKQEKNYGRVKSPTGTILEVQGLRKFSRQYDLDPSTLSKLCDGTFKQYKGWTKYV